MKYTFTEEIKEIELNNEKRILHRIKALKNFKSGGQEVHIGDLGGFVESIDNLSQEDDKAWVFDEALVFEDTKVYDGASIFNNAQVFGGADVL